MIGGTAARAAEPPSTIYVADICHGPSDGTEARPYCSISEAAAVAKPGQTVAVGTGVYPGPFVVPSGQPGKPITFSGYRGAYGRTAIDQNATGPAIVFSGAHDVVVDGFDVGYGQTRPTVVIENSSNITFSDARIVANKDPGVEIKGDSHAVTVSGTTVRAIRARAFVVGAGTTDTVLSGNSVLSTSGVVAPLDPAITVTDAPRTTITNNTVVVDCAAGVAVTGASAGFALYNTIVRSTLLSLPGHCKADAGLDAASVAPVTVSGAATTDGRVDYNVIDPGHGGPLYSWAGADYANPTLFQASTGQGSHDIGADPKLDAVDESSYGAGWSPGDSSPAIDSALADAPGILATDLRGNAHADKPDVANSGGGYVDRGAVELVPTPTVTTAISHTPGGGALDTVFTGDRTYPWPTDGPIGTFLVRGDGQREVRSRDGVVPFTFRGPGQACATVTFSLSGFRLGGSVPYIDSPCMTVGGGYAAITPQRVLDTRSAVGAPDTTPLPSHGQLSFAIPGVAATASAVVLNVAVTKPASSGSLGVMPSDKFWSVGTNLHFVANQTIANLVTVPVHDGKVSLYNDSAGTVHVLADLVGYYANTANGFTAGTPARVLDTRNAIGVPGSVPVGAQGRVIVDVSSRVPAGTTAVALNLTITKPTQSGHITVFPNGSPVPVASNVNFVAGQTVNNMVIAPVVGGKIALAHGGSGAVHVIADLAGWFAPGAGGAFLPTYLSRRLFGPNGVAGLIGPGQSVRVFIDSSQCGPVRCEPRSSVVANLTVESAAAAGYLSIYPYGQPRPVMSVLNFNKGQTVSTQATVGIAEDSFVIFNSSSTTVEVSVDQFGFYFGSVS
ncbi:right-handed parallel beta-helix repeat-containing protein [Asanoa hainanensis]|nr:right-handed parallel beta-helix repeat-containing protein [Asanoa hainanensis]